MLYQTYQFQNDMLTPVRFAARWGMALGDVFGLGLGDDLKRRMLAAMEMVSRFELSHARPSFGIDSVTVGNREVTVTEEVDLRLPFGDLLHFKKDIDTRQPKVLIVAPLSGHFATLLAGTVKTMLQDHDVYITDWTNA
ncbi:MAG: polyhydroxyalkanoate depolymerase, partial [Pseudomonadota bacterium]|nr:polyhydroxyalkanoate depolymerase [Pseudomonadota bacterium]